MKNSVLGLGAVFSAGKIPAQSFKKTKTRKQPGLPKTNGKPNILWIQTDEQRPDSLGCYGSSWAKTPNLDLLAHRGTTMLNCVCQSPVCVPSRTSQMSARYPQECNVMLNDPANEPEVVPEGLETFPEVFAKSGYTTFNLGKKHTPLKAWQRSNQFTWGMDQNLADYCELGPGYNEEDYHVIKRPGIHPIIVGGKYPIFDQNPTMRQTDEAIKYLRIVRKDKPFMMRVSYNWPHTPVLPPGPFFKLYQNGEIPIQPFDKGAYEGRASVDRAFADAQRMFDLNPQQYEQMWKDYMGLVGYIDYEIGRILAALKALGLDENTIVMFSSDHGRALGEYGHGEKCSFDNNVWRVPFIWSWPGHIPENKVRTDLCELIDTGKTLTGLAGIEDNAPSSWRGRNIFSSASEPEAVFGQIGYPNRNAPYMQTPRMKRKFEKDATFLGRKFNALEAYPIYGLMRVSVRTDRYRMDVSWMKNGKILPPSEKDGNLFDLQTDPQEKNNLWNDSASSAVVKDLTAKIQKWYDGLDKPELIFGSEGTSS